MSLRRFNIAPRATFFFALITLLVVVLGGFALLRLGDLFAAEQDIETNWMASIEASDEMQKDLLHIRLETLRILASSEENAALKADQTAVQSYRGELRRVIDDYEKRLVASDEERQIVQRVRAALDAYLDEQQQVLDLSNQQQHADALQLANSTLRSKAGDLETLLGELSHFNQAGARQAGVAASSNYDHGRLGVLITIAAAVGLTVLLAWLLTRSIVSPINDALAIAETIADGDLTRPIRLDGEDEAARLLAALATMQRNLQQAIRQIGDSSTQLASAAEEMAAVTDESTRGLQSQNAEIEQAATAVNEMSAAVEEVSRNAIGASDAASLSNTSANTGNRHVAQTIEAIRRLSGRVADTSLQVQGLAGQARDISKVLDVIRSIAEQTNLLALNAAIEAARAGDQGRGFAVVADEVRALAHRTAASTQEIEQMISTIQQGTDNAVQAMRTSSDEAAATLGMADEAGHSLEEIVEAIGQINQRNLQIATASEEQAHVAREVDRNLVSIRDLSVQSAAGAQQSAAACSELARLAIDLNALVGRFRV
ncbi:methyl-accepting chemotaxis protein [Pseudomonas sp.]|uniref:methyl-accepting chemotaxis protein n=1 Tax=Pseudomonas sp. TaxID=306 RepID=UPI0028AA7F18|nr:methyl-accepting chemotaxis protein [Pseudomonas sp.]